VEDLEVRTVSDDFAGGQGVDAPAGASAELGDVIMCCLTNSGVDRDSAGLVLGCGGGLALMR
jgi:hypothetical protein